jgi:tetratricopeptide (TPR) repeat protein
MVIKMRLLALLLLFVYLFNTDVYSQDFNITETVSVPIQLVDNDELIKIDAIFESPSAEIASVLPSTFQSFYEADWNRTRNLIAQLKRADPSDPFPHFLSAMIPFWTYFFGGNEPEVAQQFLELSSEAIKIGEKRLEMVPTDTSAILLLSGLHGYRSLVAAREKQYRIAMSSGITGYSFTKTLLKMNDRDPNTLMGQGVFHYMVGSIPAEVRWMVRLAGLSGSKEQGLEMLEAAALSDSHVSNDARMFLSHLYEQEGRFTDAQRHLLVLSHKYPTNLIFLYNLARMHEAKKQSKDAELAYKRVLSTPTNELNILHVLSSNRLKELESSPLKNASY